MKPRAYRGAWVFALLISISFALPAQNLSEQERLRLIEIQREQEYQRKIKSSIDTAAQLIEAGAYEEADERLRTLLRTVRSVPSDLVFYIGKNSHFMGQYKQSIDWLNKYIQLRGTSGQFSAEAAELLRKSELGLVQKTQGERKRLEEIFSRDYQIDCGPTGKVVCPVCAGSTVVVKKTYMGDRYSACGFCHQKGYLSCEDYNKLIRGQLKPAGTQ